MALRENKDALKLWRVLGIQQVGSAEGIIVHGQLLPKSFFARPQDFRGFVKSINTI